MDLIPHQLREAIPEGPAIPREFAEQFEAEHLHRLRQRVFWYCAAVLSLLVLAITRIGLEVAAPAAVREPVGYIILRVVSVLTLVSCYIGVTLYILPARRGRAQIIHAYSLLIITTTLVLTLAMPRLDNGRFVPGAEPHQFGAAALAQQCVTLFFILLLHLIASLLVELSPRDGVKIYLPMVLIYLAGLVIDPYLTLHEKLWLSVVAPILGLPGLLWSLWRHRAFADRFVTRAMTDRYARFSKELDEARRVHEALFPPPVSRGRVQVRYRYEPMQDIGGDFLYIHPIPSPRMRVDAPLSVVLIDVTGHGFPAALAVNRLYVELTRAFTSSDDPSPAHIIAELNESMASGLMPEAIFATAMVFRVRTEAGAPVLEWCGAGHPDAILLRSDGFVERLSSSTPMLGVLAPDIFAAADARLDITPGDRVLAYTDGVLEAKDARGEQFGLDRIESVVRDAAHSPASDTGDVDDSAAGRVAQASPQPAPPGASPYRAVDTLFAAVEAFRDGPTRDDVLIVELTIAE